MKTNAHDASKVLFSKAQQRLICLFYLKPDTSFCTSEILEFAKIGRGGVQRELEKFLHAGLVNQQITGKQKLYKANDEHLFFHELQNIAKKSFGVKDQCLAYIEPILHKIKLAFIYGSIASGTESSDSDVDLMLIGDDLSFTEIYPLLEKATLEIGREINPSCYTPVEWRKKLRKKNNFILQVLKKPKIFLKGAMKDLEELR